MKVALVILHAEPARGGAERYTVDLARALIDRGVEAKLVAASFGPETQNLPKAALARGGVSKLGRYLRFLAALDEHLKSHRYDAVHAMLPVKRCDIYHPHAGIAAEALATGHLKHRSALGRSAAHFFSQWNRKRNAFASVERALLTGERPPIVLCLSDYIRAAVHRHYPIADQRLVTLLNGIDLNKFDPAARPGAGLEVRARFGLAQADTVALLIAQDFQRKGLAQAIEALAKLAAERLKLLVVGKPDPAVYRRLAERLGVAKQVIFAGPTADPQAFYKAADFFVLPTRHDPCSLVVLEALAMGLPIISTRQNGACEAMTDGVHGFVLQNPDDVAALSDRFRQMLSAEKRSEMAAKCLAIRPGLSDATHVQKLLCVYGSVRPEISGLGRLAGH